MLLKVSENWFFIMRFVVKLIAVPVRLIFVWRKEKPVPVSWTHRTPS